MSNSFVFQSDAELLIELSREIELLPRLPAEDQQRLLKMARGLEERGMSLPFVIAGIRASAEVLADLAAAGDESVMNRPEVRRFVQENAAPGDQSDAALFRGNDVKRAERDRLLQQTLATIGEARRSRGRHEIKKTRNMLMKIDHRALRLRLGKEGDDLCREISTILRSWAPMF